MAPKRDPRDYMFRKEKGPQTLLKKPGALQGNGFLLDRVEDCEVYICDHTSQVQIDDCNNCKIFIGPCDGSVFIRDSKNCSLCICCRQLRTRDCQDLDISLCCATQPSLETSNGVVLSPWAPPAYPELQEQIQKAGLDPAGNTWDQVYDFSAGEEVNGDMQHWCLNHNLRPRWVTPLDTPAASPAGTSLQQPDLPEDPSLPSRVQPATEPSAPSTPPQDMFPHTANEPPQLAPVAVRQGQPQLQPQPEQHHQHHHQHHPNGVSSGQPNGSTGAGATLYASEDAREAWHTHNRARLVAQRQAEEESKRKARDRAAKVLQEKAQARAATKEACHAGILNGATATEGAFKASQGVSGTDGLEGWPKVTNLLRDPATNSIRHVLGTEGPKQAVRHNHGRGNTLTTRQPNQGCSNGNGNGGVKDVGRMREVLLSLANQD